MNNKNYTNIDTANYQNQTNTETVEGKKNSPLSRNFAYIALTALIGISLIITLLIFTRNSPIPTISKLNTSKVTLYQKAAVNSKTALNSADISDKNIFEKSTYDKSKEVKLPPPQDPYAKKSTPTPTPSPKPTVKPKTKTVIIAQKPATNPTATNTPTSTPKPTSTTMPTATPTIKPTAKPTATPTVTPTMTIIPTKKPTSTPVKATATPVKPTVTVAKPTTAVQKPTVTPVVAVQTSKDSYIVKKGDSLWKIAESVYGTGFKAADIAKANKLTQAGLIYAGQKLILPKAEVMAVENKIIVKAEPTKPAEVKKERVSNSKPEILAANTKVTDKVQKYTVVAGDNLWNIAVQFYGDGFAWKKIAEANKLANPSIIHKGNVLSIPAKK